MKKNYKLIPFNEITDEARQIAIAWLNHYIPNASIYPEIAQKHKLASDIMNYAANQNKLLLRENEKLKNENIQLTILLGDAIAAYQAFGELPDLFINHAEQVLKSNGKAKEGTDQNPTHPDSFT